jgi:hypothetical protein
MGAMDRPLRIVACWHITDELNGPPLGLQMTHSGPQDCLRPSRSSPANSSDRFRPVHRRTPEGGAGNAHRSEAEAVDLDIAADEPDLRASSVAIVRGPTGLTRAIWEALAQSFPCQKNWGPWVTEPICPCGTLQRLVGGIYRTVATLIADDLCRDLGESGRRHCHHQQVRDRISHSGLLP